MKRENGCTESWDLSELPKKSTPAHMALHQVANLQMGLTGRTPQKCLRKICELSCLVPPHQQQTQAHGDSGYIFSTQIGVNTSLLDQMSG